MILRIRRLHRTSTYYFQEEKRLRKDLKIEVYDNTKYEIPKDSICRFYYDYYDSEGLIVYNNSVYFYDRRDLRKYVVFGTGTDTLQQVNIPLTSYDVVDTSTFEIECIIYLNNKYEVYKGKSNLYFVRDDYILVVYGVIMVKGNLILLH